ncbi:MAG: M48 family metalloprotease, partial [Acidobacteriota bacterium]
LLESIETDEELAAVLAHEITHVENRHTYREWRKASTVGAIVGILGAVAGAKSEEVKDIVSQMAAFSARLFLSGFGRDREREADSFASLYVNTVGASSQPFESVLRKLKYTQDVFDPFGNAVQGPFATHPHIDERLSKARDTVTRAFRAGKSFRGLTAQGETVAVLTLEIQRLYGRELEVIATLSTTAELGKKDNVNTLTLELSNKRLELKERTAESVYPGDEVSALFRTDKATGLIEEPVTGVRLKLRNVVRWEPADRE